MLKKLYSNTDFMNFETTVRALQLIFHLTRAKISTFGISFFLFGVSHESGLFSSLSLFPFERHMLTGVCVLLILYLLVVYEVFERMAFYGISSNLVIYLTKKLHQGTVSSSNNVTNWVGTIWMTPILGAYLADAHLGRYWTFVIASCIYLSVIAP